MCFLSAFSFSESTLKALFDDLYKIVWYLHTSCNDELFTYSISFVRPSTDLMLPPSKAFLTFDISKMSFGTAFINMCARFATPNKNQPMKRH